jgi:hypothetical protein
MYNVAKISKNINKTQGAIPRNKSLGCEGKYIRVKARHDPTRSTNQQSFYS